MAVITTEAIPIFRDSEKNNRRMRTLGDMMKDFLTGGGTVKEWNTIKVEILNFLNIRDDAKQAFWTQKEIQIIETKIITETCEKIVKGAHICPHLIFYDASRIPKELLSGKSVKDFESVKIIHKKLLDNYKQGQNLEQPPPPIPVVVMTGPSLADPANNRMTYGKGITSPFVNTFPKKNVKVVIENSLLRLYLGLEIDFSYEYKWKKECIDGGLNDIQLRESLECSYTYENSRRWMGHNGTDEPYPKSREKSWVWSGENNNVFKTERKNTYNDDKEFVKISGNIAPTENTKAPWFQSNNSKADIRNEADVAYYKYQDTMESHKGKNNGDALQPLAQLICDMLIKKYGFFYEDDFEDDSEDVAPNLCTFNFGKIKLELNDKKQIQLVIEREPVPKSGEYFSNMKTAPYRTVMLSPDKNLPYLCNNLGLKCCYTGGSSSALITRADGPQAVSNNNFQRQMSLTRQTDTIKKIRESLTNKSLQYQSKLLYKAQVDAHPKCFLGRQGNVGRRNRLGYINIQGNCSDNQRGEEIIKEPILDLLEVIIIAYESMNFDGEGSEILDSEIFTTQKTCSMVACMQALIFNMMSGGIPQSGIVHNILGIDLSIIKEADERPNTIIKDSLFLLKEILDTLSNPNITCGELEKSLSGERGFTERIIAVRNTVRNSNPLVNPKPFIGLDDYDDDNDVEPLPLIGGGPKRERDNSRLPRGKKPKTTQPPPTTTTTTQHSTPTTQPLFEADELMDDGSGLKIIIEGQLKIIIKGLLTVINHNDRNHMNPVEEFDISSKFGDNRPLFPVENATVDLNAIWAEFDTQANTEGAGDKTELFNGGDDDGNVNNLFEIIKSEFEEHNISRTLRSLICYNIITTDTLLFALSEGENRWFEEILLPIYNDHRDNITTLLIYCVGSPAYPDVIQFTDAGKNWGEDINSTKFQPTINFVENYLNKAGAIRDTTRLNLRNLQPSSFDNRLNKGPNTTNKGPNTTNKGRKITNNGRKITKKGQNPPPLKDNLNKSNPVRPDTKSAAHLNFFGVGGGGVNKKRYSSGKQTHYKNKSHKKKRIYNKTKKKKSHKEIRKPQRKKSHKEIRKPQRKKSQNREV